MTTVDIYRRDIDGLRAMAVLAVVLFHAGVPGFSGGFVGVDVFFVISGFLITGIIRRDIEAGRFSLLDFYDRRIRRILPALFVVLACTFATAVVLLGPEDLVTFGRSVVAAGLFASNVFFQRDDGYFAGEAAEKPLLHTWSLSVEEQFYIVWPLLLILLLTRAPQRTGLVLAGLACLSLGLTQAVLERDPQAAFYLAPLRAWELIVGAALAFPLVPRCRSGGIANAVAAVGFGLIAWSVVTYDEGTLFPGVTALAPCLGAALVIHAGAERSTLIGRFLSLQPMVFVGLISYSLYLWHWPVLVFLRYHLGRSPSLPEAIVAIAGATVLAMLSWRLIERPFRVRASHAGRIPASIYAAAAGLLCTLAFGGILTESDGLRNRFAPHVLAALDSQGQRDPRSRRCITGELTLPPITECIEGAETAAAHGIALWGDSHAAHYFPALIRLAEERGSRVRLLAKGSCPPLPGTSLLDENGRDRKHCRAFHDAAFAEILEQPQVRLVVLAARWALYTETREHIPIRKPATFLVDDETRALTVDGTRRVLTRVFERTVGRLTAAGKTVLILGQVPEFGFSPPACVAQRRMGRERECSVGVDAVARRQQFSDQLFARLDDRKNVFVFDATAYLCGRQRCETEIAGRILYRDRTHLTRDGALYLAGFLSLPVFGSASGNAISANKD